MESDSGFNMGRSAEITRDEVKFFKFIEKIRSRFSDLFLQLLRVQAITKGIMSEEDWNNIIVDVRFEFNKDSYFTELKETEILKERVDILTQLDEYIGKYYSTAWVRKNILRQNEEEMKLIDEQIEKESAIEPPEEEQEEG